MHDLPTGTVILLFTDMEGSTRPLQQLNASSEWLRDRYSLLPLGTE
jgi:hypothetical protein